MASDLEVKQKAKERAKMDTKVGNPIAAKVGILTAQNPKALRKAASQKAISQTRIATIAGKKATFQETVPRVKAA